MNTIEQLEKTAKSAPSVAWLAEIQAKSVADIQRIAEETKYRDAKTEVDLFPASGLISDNAGNSALSVRKTPTIWGN